MSVPASSFCAAQYSAVPVSASARWASGFLLVAGCSRLLYGYVKIPRISPHLVKSGCGHRIWEIALGCGLLQYLQYVSDTARGTLPEGRWEMGGVLAGGMWNSWHMGNSQELIIVCLLCGLLVLFRDGALHHESLATIFLAERRCCATLTF